MIYIMIISRVLHGASILFGIWSYRILQIFWNCLETLPWSTMKYFQIMDFFILLQFLTPRRNI